MFGSIAAFGVVVQFHFRLIILDRRFSIMVALNSKVALPAGAFACEPLPVGLQVADSKMQGLHMPDKRTPAGFDMAPPDFPIIVEASEVSLMEVPAKCAGIELEEGVLKSIEVEKNTDIGHSSSGGLSSSVAIPGHTAILKHAQQQSQRQCTVCKIFDHWRYMRRVIVKTHYQQFKMQAPDEEVEVHTCMKCVALEMNITEAEAKTEVLAVPMAHKKQRFANLQQGKTLAAQKISAMESCSRTQRRELIKCCMFELFGPLAKRVICQKYAVEKCYRDTLCHAELAVKVEGCTHSDSKADILTGWTSLLVGKCVWPQMLLNFLATFVSS
jgi:hypothetical protein